MLLHIYLSYPTETFRTYLKIHIKLTELVYHTQRPRNELFLNMCYLCRYARFLQAQSHIFIDIFDITCFTQMYRDHALFYQIRY